MGKMEEAPSALQIFIFDFPTENIKDFMGILGGLKNKSSGDRVKQYG